MTFVDHLSRYAPQEWVSAIAALTPQIHPIDQHAARVWFAIAPKLPLAGQVESSHTFLYGHRHWPQVKRAILAASKEASWPGSLTDLIVDVSDHATRTTQVDRDQLLGITAAALYTLRHVGLDAFAATTGRVQLPRWSHVRSIRQVRRARQPRRPLSALLGKRRFRVTYSEAAKGASVRVADGHTVASGLPKELTRCGATCSGACVVGVLAGADHLSNVSAHEAALLKKVGCAQTMSPGGDALIRLACYAKPSGDVTLAMPRLAI